MKTFFFFLMLLPSSFCLTAQIHTGSVLLGGTAGINTHSEDGSSTTLITISPSTGFFLSRRLALGTEAEFTVMAGKGPAAKSLGQSLFVRYYYTGSGVARLFSQVDAGVNISDLSQAKETTSLVAGLRAGVDVFLNENVAIEGWLGYRRVQDIEAKTGVNSVGLNFGVVVFIGCRQEQ